MTRIVCTLLAVVTVLCAQAQDTVLVMRDTAYVVRRPGPRALDTHFNQVPMPDLTASLSVVSLKISTRVAITNLLKKHVHEWRPDGSADNSFPSRHAVWAFGMAGSIAYTTGRHTPWIALLSHAGADAVGMQRVMARRHWPGDVMAGAGIGLGLDIGIRSLTNVLFRRENPYALWHTNRNTLHRSVSISTGCEIPFDSEFGNYRIGTGLTSAVNVTLANRSGDSWFGADIEASLASAPVKTDDTLIGIYNSLSILGGPVVNWCIADGPVGISLSALGGYRRNFETKNFPLHHSSLEAKGRVKVTVALTPALSIGAEAGVQVVTLHPDKNLFTHKDLSSFTAGIVSRANF